MYGVIHFVVKDMIVSQFGQEALDKILLAAGLEESKHFKMFSPYEDEVLEALLGATSQCLGLPVETVLEVFGDYFIMFTLRHGYDDMLRTLGSDMTSFIQNLDSLHSLLALSYEKMVAPSFRCSMEEDGSLTLHYHSSRSGYYPLVKGLLIAAAREIFNQKVDIKMISSFKEEVKKGRDQEHVIFHVTIIDQPRAVLNTSEQHQTEGAAVGGNCHLEDQPFDLTPVTLSKNQFATAFPYHLIFDQHLRLRQFGCNVARLSPVPLREGMKVTLAFRILYPRIAFEVANICRFINNIFILALDPDDSASNDSAFSMKGQMMWLEETRLMIFIGSPRLMSLKEMKRLNMYMADIPLYDVTREMVLLYQQRNAEIDITRKLDETTAELTRTSRELELEKQRTEHLLYQMLPEKVANQLKNGKKVEAEKFDQVTVLFSDIVNFTGIAAASTPLDVVNMLNALYHKFDVKTNEHKVYKVETIGDAYMVVSGVPDITDKHAQRVANFALDMVSQAVKVLSPDTEKPLQIRVGLHSGPVVAGVVGVKMPRYCLFGDTVNTASRMESHSVPSRIHVSPNTYKHVKDHGYLCRERGEVLIKGKGLMSTYFLIGQQCAIFEPNDEHCSLPIAGANGLVPEYSVSALPAAIEGSDRPNGYHKDLPPHNESQLKDSNVLPAHNHSPHVQPHTDSSTTEGGSRNKLGTSSSAKAHVKGSIVTGNENRLAKFVISDSKVQGKLGTTNTKNNHEVDSYSEEESETSTSASYSTTSGSSRKCSVTEDNDRRQDQHGTYLSEQFSLTEDQKKFHLIACNGGNREKNILMFGRRQDLDDKSRYQAAIKDRRVNDLEVGRFPLHSKTCCIL